MSAPTLQMIAAIKALPQVTTMVLLSCGCDNILDGVFEKGTVGRCLNCAEYVTVIQAFPGMDI